MRRRFLVERMEGGGASVRGPQARHLATVLRARPGQTFELACEGKVRRARVVAVAAGEVRFALEDEIAAPPDAAGVTLASALFKFDRFEWMLEKATELGVTAIAPVVSRRTQARLAAAAPGRAARWQRLLQSASQQARRRAAPLLAATLPLAAYLGQERSGAGWLLEEGSSCAWPGAAPGAATVLIGPEGGWAPGEAAAIAAAGFRPAGLGPRILRCETAAIAALALLTCGR